MYDFFMGRELNPRFKLFGQDLDVKYFCELRPGLIGWMILNVAFLVAQLVSLENTGGAGVTDAMVFVFVSQAIYIIDALWNESSVLTTMDIVQDGMGFMLSFGDLVWVPFTFCTQARYLALHPHFTLGPWLLCGVSFVQLVGFVIFRVANRQKDMFKSLPKNDPRISKWKFIATSSSSRLLADGLWSWARHLNYFGDWLMGFAWCLSCGFDSPIPYFYAAYFAILLVHRERRDEDKCRKKYGKAWQEYVSIVPWRIIPFVY
jgi:delta14-sterol reductase